VNALVWVAMTALVLALYPLSVGPYVRLYNEEMVPEWGGYAYVPVLWLVEVSPEPVGNAFNWYQDLWLPTPSVPNSAAP
jgi:hypothetical protein